MADARNSLKSLANGLKERPYTRFPPLDPESDRELTWQEKDERALDEKTSSPDERQHWKELVEMLRLHRRTLLRIPGVTAVDIGYRIEGNQYQDELALRVHVERKLPPKCFDDRPQDLIPKELTTRSGRTIKVDVMEAEYKLVQLAQPPRPRNVVEMPQEYANRRRRLDPLVGGISIGSPQVPVGTLGALVWDRTDGSVCILSNWHVLAGDLNAEAGNPCYQPGLFDQGRSSDVIARLKRWSFNRHTDAAIAELTGSRHYCAGEIVSMFQQISNVTKPHLGMKVLKSGRSTGFTPGFIDGLYFSAAIEYSGGIVRVFEEQIHIAPLPPENPNEPVLRISEPGDSGSVWVTELNGEGYRAVGLHFAGDLPRSAFGEYALANPMIIVAERLNFSFRPLFLEIRDEDVIRAAQPQTTQIRLRNGNGSQPVRIVVDGLTGPGSQPEDEEMGAGGQPKPAQAP